MNNKAHHTFFSTKVLAAAVVVLVLGTANYANAKGKPGGPPGGGPVDAQLAYLTDAIGTSGFVDSFPTDQNDYAYAYDSGMAALAFMSSNDTATAQTILDAFLAIGPDPSGGFVHRYDAETGLPVEGLLRAGHNAYILQAMNYYYDLTGDSRYNSLAVGIADYLLSLQDTDGGIRGHAAVSWKSTENNLAAYGAIKSLGTVQGLQTYSSAANQIHSFIATELWDGTRFLTGENDPMITTDSQALGTQVMGASYDNGSYWVENHTLNTDGNGPQRITGFDLNNDKDGVWTEGTLQQALAFHVAGDSNKADYYETEAQTHIRSSGGLYEASGTMTTGFGEFFSKIESTSATSWYILSVLNANVLAPIQ